jgi:hypothetical protein
MLLQPEETELLSLSAVLLSFRLSPCLSLSVYGLLSDARGWFWVLHIPLVSTSTLTWQWDGFSGVFAEIGSSWVPDTTFRAVPILASNSQRYSYSKNDSPTPMRRVDFRIRISPKIRSQNRNGLTGSVRDLGQSDLCKNIEKTGSLPCPCNHFISIAPSKPLMSLGS